MVMTSCLPRISRLCSTFIFFRRFKRAHIYTHVSILLNGNNQGSDKQIFNRISISREIMLPQPYFKNIILIRTEDS